MGKLKEQMRADLQLKGFSKSTQYSYLECVKRFAYYFMKSPAEMGEEEVKRFLLYLHNEKEYQPSTIVIYVAALKFLYTNTLKNPEVMEYIPYPRVPGKLTDILSAQEMVDLLLAVRSIKYRAMIMTTYACGLRVREVCRLSVGDIDSKRMLIHIRKGKGAKDRYVGLSPTLLTYLRHYWRTFRPTGPYLFPGRNKSSHVRPDSIQEVVRKAADACGISKKVTPHVLRHTFATHLLESGVDIRIIQQLLGHRSIITTAKYTRVSNKIIAKIMSPLDLIGTEAGKDIG